MKPLDEKALKSEIDEISKKIDNILQKINEKEPNRTDNDEPEDP